MKFFHAEITVGPIGVSADFVYGRQRIVDVERVSSRPFRHDRSGELLPAHDEIEVVRFPMLEVPGRLRPAKPVAENRTPGLCREPLIASSMYARSVSR